MRYDKLFSSLKAKNEGAFIPFAVLGDPGKTASLEALEALIEGGADALELGFPFSDPLADGPAIQAADIRALAAGTRADDCFEIIAEIRRRHDALPIGLLVYANLICRRGAEKFFRDALAAGADLESAAHFANTAAGIVVGKFGTATVSPEEILAFVA